MLFSSTSIFSQNANKKSLVPDTTSFLFSYRNSTGANMVKHDYVRTTCNSLNAFLRHYRMLVLSGKSHLSIVASIRPADITNPQIINRASVQGNAARTYIRMIHKINNSHITFVFDTINCTSYRVRIDYIPSPVQSSANRNIYYTLKKTNVAMRAVALSYRPIPLLSAIRKVTEKNNQAIEREILPITPLMGKRSIPVQLKRVPMINLVKVDVHPAKVNFMPVFGLKTNLVYWAGYTPELKHRYVMPNIEAEFYFSRKWSVNVDYIYTSIDKKNISREAWKVTSMAVEPRFWVMKSKIYEGLYIGAYGLKGEFDVKLKSLSSLGYTGDFYEGGLSLGYYKSLSSHLGLEIGGKFGCRFVDGETYNFKDPHYYKQSSFTQNGFKLTGIRFLVTYRLGKNIKIKSDK